MTSSSSGRASPSRSSTTNRCSLSTVGILAGSSMAGSGITREIASTSRMTLRVVPDVLIGARVPLVELGAPGHDAWHVRRDRRGLRARRDGPNYRSGQPSSDSSSPVWVGGEHAREFSSCGGVGISPRDETTVLRPAHGDKRVRRRSAAVSCFRPGARRPLRRSPAASRSFAWPGLIAKAIERPMCNSTLRQELGSARRMANGPVSDRRSGSSLRSARSGPALRASQGSRPHAWTMRCGRSAGFLRSI